MPQTSEPSYLLADFPSADNQPHATDLKDPRTTSLSVDNADALELPQSHTVRNGERGFKRKFMPGRFLADCTATIVPIALVVFAIVIMRLDRNATEQAEYQKMEECN